MTRLTEGSIIKEEIKLVKALQRDRDLLYGFALGILASLLATMFFKEFIEALPKNFRYSIETVFLIIFLIILIPFIRRYKYNKEFVNSHQSETWWLLAGVAA